MCGHFATCECPPLRRTHTSLHTHTSAIVAQIFNMAHRGGLAVVSFLLIAINSETRGGGTERGGKGPTNAQGPTLLEMYELRNFGK